MSSFQLVKFSAIRHCEPTGRRDALPDDRLREAIQRWIRALWIASLRSLSSGAHSRDPLASRNDGKYDPDQAFVFLTAFLAGWASAAFRIDRA